MLILGVYVAYMVYGYKTMLIWWYIYVCVVYDLLYNIMGTYKGWLYNKGTYNSRWRVYSMGIYKVVAYKVVVYKVLYI